MRVDKGCETRSRADPFKSSRSFLTRSKTVFTYAEGGGTLMHVTYQVEWSGKSMLKSRSAWGISSPRPPS